jgi:bifunctional enzyme CysN/CysC
LNGARIWSREHASAGARSDEFPHEAGSACRRFEIADGGPVDMTDCPDQRKSPRSTNIVAVEHRVTPVARVQRAGHEGGVLWFTGLSGAGKSTLAFELEHRLFDEGYAVYVLDGDNLRHGLNDDLGFSPRDRTENIRRVGEVAALFAHAGILAISAFISPYRSNRERARKAAGAGFHEIYIKADVEVCEQRDPKGLYARARRGEITEFTGISAPYEPPETCELTVDTAQLSVGESVATLVSYVRRAFPLRR